MQLYAGEGYGTILFPGVCVFRCGRNEIQAYALNHGLEYLVEICLIGNVMAYWLERRGTTALHASAVVIAGRAVGFLAGTSRGKTTIACALLGAGFSLLSDDIVPIVGTLDGTVARPAFPQMKLLPHQLDHFWPGHRELALVHPGFQKRLTPIGGPHGFGSFHEHEAPLDCVYLLDREESPDTMPSLTELGEGERLRELVRHSFAAEMVDAVDRSGNRLARLAGIAGSVPMKRIQIPEGYDRLEEVSSVIVDDVAGRAQRRSSPSLVTGVSGP